MKKNLFWVFWVFLFSTLLAVASGIGYVIGLGRGRAISSKDETSGFKESLEMQEPKYKIASICVDKNCPAEVEWRLGDDGRTVLLRVYDESAVSSSGPSGCPMLPVVLKIFSRENGGLKEEYVYKFDDNAFSSIRVVENFWGEGRDAVLVETIFTGCGSGYVASLNFLKTDNDNGELFYQVVSGPRFGELDYYKIVNEREILLAKAIWVPNEAHFEPHRYHLEKYVWNPAEKKFAKSDLGTTKGKYTGSLEEIIAAEPEVLEK